MVIKKKYNCRFFGLGVNPFLGKEKELVCLK